MKNIAIYGTGQFALDIIKKYKDINIKFFIDEFLEGSFLNKPIFKASEIDMDLIKDIDLIFICISNNEYRSLAVDRLMERGVSLKMIDFPILSQTVDEYTLGYLFDYDYSKVKDAISNKSFDLQGWFPLGNQKELIKLLQNIKEDNIRVLEVGSWKGLSTSIIAKTLCDKNVEIYCIDTWEGTVDIEEHMIKAKEKNILNVFIENLKYLNLFNNVKPLKMTSFEGAKILKDGQFDIIFIDAVHTYDYIYNDIKNFLPKLKKGGIICGDDAENYYTKLPSDFIEKNKNKDFVLPEEGIEESFVKGYHCGVIKSLYEHFKDNYNLEKDSSFWWKEV